MMSFITASQPSNKYPSDSQLRKVYAAALQSKAKDTIISSLEERIKEHKLAIQNQKTKDSIRVEWYRKDSIFTEHQKKLLLDQVVQLNRSLRWQKAKGWIYGGGFGAAILYIGINMLKK